MTDIFDEIIEKLPPSTLKLISEYNKDRVERTENANRLIHEFQNVKIRQVNRELKRKIFDIQLKTSENRNYLSKLKNELEVLKSLKKTQVNEQSLKAYTGKIGELESKLRSLTKDHNNIDLTQLFNEVEDFYQQIQEYKKKIAEAKTKYQSYDGFPPDIEQGKEIIAKIKERIKENEAVVESLHLK